jgi:predicted P-loop ATPase
VDTFTNALVAIHKMGLKPSWDELRQNVLFRAGHLPWQEQYGRVLNDHLLRQTRMALAQQFQGVDYEPGAQHTFDALAGLAYQRKFNPVLEYLASLKWDGTPRVENLFPIYFNCGDDAYTRAVSVAFMVGAVRRMRSPGSKFDTMPVMKGAQGVGKSSGVKALFGADWFSDADLGNLKDKDSALKLRGIWCHEWAEIEGMNRAETGQLKAFLSRATDRQRDPYARVVEDQPRRCVFIGTCNEGGYLKDSTGGRRFWPLDVAGPIDLDRISADRDQLWAEAAAMEAQGVSDVLPAELWPEAGKRQAEQTSSDPWADVFRDFLDQRVDDWQDHALDLAPDGIPMRSPSLSRIKIFQGEVT